LVTAIVLLFRFSQTKEGKALLDQLAFKVPIFGELARRAGTARFSRTLATLLSSGVNLIEAIDICTATIDNTVLEEAVAKIRSEIESGKTLGLVLTRLDVFPRMAVQMISVGEATGALDKMLEKVADFYEEEVEQFVATIGKLIEPLILVFLGGTVAFLMIAMYLPIFKAAGGAGD
jgi:type IV pilus assembly protein PilC